MPRFVVCLALVSTALTAAFGWRLLSAQWHPRAPFDVLGVLWLLTNLPQLVAWALLFGLVLLTLYGWVVVFRHRGSGRGPLS